MAQAVKLIFVENKLLSFLLFLSDSLIPIFYSMNDFDNFFNGEIFIVTMN